MHKLCLIKLSYTHRYPCACMIEYEQLLNQNEVSKYIEKLQIVCNNHCARFFETFASIGSCTCQLMNITVISLAVQYKHSGSNRLLLKPGS